MRRCAILTAVVSLGCLVCGRPVHAQTEVEWTVLLDLHSDDANANRGDEMISEFNELEAVGSSANVNLVVQWDRGANQDSLDLQYPTDTTQAWASTRRYLIIKDPSQNSVDPNSLLVTDPGYRLNSPMLLDLGQVDSGNPNHLVDLFTWTQTHFPARHYMLVTSGLGQGWKPRSRGMLFDSTPNNGTFISNSGLRQALIAIKALRQNVNLDLLALDVSGYANIETVYQTRDQVDYVLARWLAREPDGFPLDLWMSQLTSTLPKTATATEDMANRFASLYLGSYGTGTLLLGGTRSTTCGAYRMSQTTGVFTAVDTLAGTLLSDLPANAPALFRVLAQVQRGNTPGLDQDNVDLGHFATLVQQEFTDPTLKAQAGAVLTALGNYLVNQSRRSTAPNLFNVDNFNGLGAYFPSVLSNFDNAYATSGDFVTAGRWDELVQGLLTLFSDQNGPQIVIGSPLIGATIIENPPDIIATIIDRDPGGRVNASSIVLTLDTRVIPSTDYTFNSTTGELRYDIPTPLSVTGHNFTITAKDLSGNQSTASGNFRIAVPSLTAGIQTFSLPRSISLAENDFSLIFGRDNFSVVRWVPLLFGVSKYRSYPDSYATMLPPDADSSLLRPTVARPPAGLGYWLRILQSRPLPTLPGQAITDPEYIVQLYRDPNGQPGWNMIADPYDVAAVGLASTSVVMGDGRRLTFNQAIDAGLTPGVVFSYVPNPSNPSAQGSYNFDEPGQGQLVRLQGHWLKVNQDITLAISAGGRLTDFEAARQRAAVPRQPADGWHLQLQAQTAAGATDHAELGASSATTSGYDKRWDVAAPPVLPGGIEVRIPHRDYGVESGRYARDYRGLRQSSAWDVEVSGPAGEVTLAWPDLRGVPAAVDLTLTDQASGVSRNLRTTAAYRFEHSGGTRPLRVTAAPHAGGGLTLSDVVLTPSRGGGYSVGYVLSRGADVKVSISGLSGRSVRELRGTAVPAGRAQLGWDGRDASGAPLPSGIYRVEVTAVAPDGSVARQVQIVRVAH
ncbi:MAG: hypothetical protein HYU66_06780 [Armatimonadetes bacterium]|nr:hypothetical protein [Armatimonadota bacterium]